LSNQIKVANTPDNSLRFFKITLQLRIIGNCSIDTNRFEASEMITVLSFGCAGYARDVKCLTLKSQILFLHWGLLKSVFLKLASGVPVPKIRLTSSQFAYNKVNLAYVANLIISWALIIK